MRASQFTGGFGGNRNSNVLNPSQGPDPFENSTPAPKPGNAGRAGITFSGSVAGALPRSSNFESAYENISLTGPSRQVFKRMGERAANQDIANFNTQTTAANDAATGAKQAEIDAYNAQVNDLNSAYESAMQTYTDQKDSFNKWKPQIDHLAGLNDVRQTALNSGTFHSYSIADQAFQNYLNSQVQLGLPGTYWSGKYSLPDAPTTPVLPDAPEPFVELQQTKELLPDTPDRRLAGNQREIVGGSLPPQVASLSGDAFTQLDVPFRTIEDLNAAEQQRIGAPKAYKFRTQLTVLPGRTGETGGQTFYPSDIGNETDTHYFIKNFGWVSKTQLTPLY